MNLLCWWFGCEVHPEHSAPVDRSRCMRCDGPMSYEDLVGLTRHRLTREWLRYWLFRRWWPKKCSDCGGRWKHDESVDHLPF